MEITTHDIEYDFSIFKTTSTKCRLYDTRRIKRETQYHYRLALFCLHGNKVHTAQFELHSIQSNRCLVDADIVSYYTTVVDCIKYIHIFIP